MAPVAALAPGNEALSAPEAPPIAAAVDAPVLSRALQFVLALTVCLFAGGLVVLWRARRRSRS